MPFIHIRYTRPTPLDAAATQALQVTATQAIADLMGKKAALTSVLVEPTAGGWAIGGVPMTHAASLDAYVTAGTNNPAEKAAFIADAMRLLRAHIGPLADATYVIIHEVHADAWGYDGQTQAARRLG